MKVRRAAALSIVMLLLTIVGCGSDPASTGITSQVTSNSAPLSSSGEARAPGESPSETVTSSEASVQPSSSAEDAMTTAPPEEPPVIKQFAAAISASDANAAQYTAPGSKAFVYAEGTDLYTHSHPGLVDKQTLSKVSGGWQLSDGPRLTDFVLDPASGLIQSFKRDSVSIDQTVAAGDGQQYVATPSEYDHWTGSVTATIHSFRYFDNSVKIVVTTKNDSNVNAELMFTSYTSGGQQFGQAMGDEALPGITRTSIEEFDGAPAGGKAYGHIWVAGSEAEAPVVDVPAMG